jgi:addiction module HigA family antidote
MAESESGYKAGLGRPPLHTRFKKGSPVATSRLTWTVRMVSWRTRRTGRIRHFSGASPVECILPVGGAAAMNRNRLANGSESERRRQGEHMTGSPSGARTGHRSWRNALRCSALRLLDVRRATLSDLINGNAGLSAEMALRIERAFGVKMGTLLNMQAWHDEYEMRQRGGEIDVKRHRLPAPEPD